MKVKNAVVVHAGLVDGSGWESVHKILSKKGYSVAIVQNPTITLEGDVAATKRAISSQDGPVLLVGHSHGGTVISQAGSNPKVIALVYPAQDVAVCPRSAVAINPTQVEPSSGLVRKRTIGVPLLL